MAIISSDNKSDIKMYCMNDRSTSCIENDNIDHTHGITMTRCNFPYTKSNLESQIV